MTANAAPAAVSPWHRWLFSRRAILTNTVTVALLLTAGGLWLEFRDRFVPRNAGTVVDGVVYRSGQIDRRLIRGFLEDRGIRRVVVMSNYEFDDPDHVAEKEASAALGIEVIRVPMFGNGVSDAESYARVVQLIHDAAEQNIPTLVHCSAGAQRTGGTVAAYRLLIEGQPPAAVYAEAAGHGWDPREDTEWPAFLNENMSAIAQRLVEAGVLDAAPDPLPVFGP